MTKNCFPTFFNIVFLRSVPGSPPCRGGIPPLQGGNDFENVGIPPLRSPLGLERFEGLKASFPPVRTQVSSIWNDPRIIRQEGWAVGPFWTSQRVIPAENTCKSAKFFARLRRASIIPNQNVYCSPHSARSIARNCSL